MAIDDLKALEAEVIRQEDQLKQTKTLVNEKRRDVINNLKAGGTTGDKLIDFLLLNWFPLEKEGYYRKINDEMVRSVGQLALVTHSYQAPSYYGGDGPGGYGSVFYSFLFEIGKGGLNFVKDEVKLPVKKFLKLQGHCFNVVETSKQEVINSLNYNFMKESFSFECYIGEKEVGDIIGGYLYPKIKKNLEEQQ